MFIHAPGGNDERLSFITRLHKNFGNKGIGVTSKIHGEEDEEYKARRENKGRDERDERAREREVSSSRVIGRRGEACSLSLIDQPRILSSYFLVKQPQSPTVTQMLAILSLMPREAVSSYKFTAGFYFKIAKICLVCFNL
jgi:hypothetical protein